MTGQPVKVTVELENENGYIKQELSVVDEAKRLFGENAPIEIV